MLIATLPAVHRKKLLEKIISHPSIDAVRYNSGAASAFSSEKTLAKVLEFTTKYNKQLWVDLKGRQLRISRWAVPKYGKIILNHEIDVDLPAKIFFRGNEWSEIKIVRGRAIFVDPPPRYAVGQGQAINIHGRNLKIRGYSAKSDFAYIRAACKLGICNFMLSFVEDMSDIHEVQDYIAKQLDSVSRLLKINLALKIESPQGLQFIKFSVGFTIAHLQLIAARDDLLINIGHNKAEILAAQKLIIEKDSNAILASRIFSSLEHSDFISTGDWADLRLAQLMGYKNFMLSDGICEWHFDKAIACWNDYLNVYG